VASFVKQTTCFGPCAGPSSGLNLRVGGDYTVRIVHYKLNKILLSLYRKTTRSRWACNEQRALYSLLWHVSLDLKMAQHKGWNMSSA